MPLGWMPNKRSKPTPASAPRALVETMESRVLFTTTAMVSGVIYDSPVAAAVEASLQATVTTQPTSAQLVAPSKLGGGLNMESDRVQDHPFTDLVKTTRGFYSLS